MPHDLDAASPFAKPIGPHRRFDWLAMDLVKVANENGADGFLPARYKSRD